MSKKAVNIVVLLLANSFLLANAVVPHHHHENTRVCFFPHCKDSKEAHKHKNDDLQTHQHEGNSSSNDCNVDDSYVAVNNNKKVASYLPVIKCDYEQTIAYCCFINSIAVNFRQKSYLPQFYSEIISPSIGLRAPPC